MLSQVRESGGGLAAKRGLECGYWVSTLDSPDAVSEWSRASRVEPLTMVGVGVVRTPADAELGLRLVAIEQGIEAWLDEHRPEFVAVERVFSQHNVRTVMGTAQASAVAMLCAARRGIPVALHTPSEVKAAVTGSGRADKAQVGAMVTRLLRLDAPPSPPTRQTPSPSPSATSGAAPRPTASNRPSPRTGCNRRSPNTPLGARKAPQAPQAPKTPHASKGRTA